MYDCNNFRHVIGNALQNHNFRGLSKPEEVARENKYGNLLKKYLLVARRPIVLTFGTSFTSIGQFGTGPLSSPKPSP